MIAKWIAACARNRFLVLAGVAALTLAGIYSLQHVPLDALPDISDVQVIIHTRWVGQPPNLIEDQVTYPIVTALLGAPNVTAVRAQTMLGDSYVFVVFQDGTDLYWARARVLEYLQRIAGQLPAGATPVLGPDATGAGWVYEYALVDHSDTQSLAGLRALQDWTLRYQLQSVPGVAEVASIGGFVREYQVHLDPDRLRAYNISLATVLDRVRASTNEVGGRSLEMSGAEYMVRGLGYLTSLDDLREIPVATHNGTPVLVGDLGTVAFGPDLRRGVAEWNGEGEAVGGIVVMRYGENARNVIAAVKAKIAALAPTLPPGVEIVAGYDRSALIDAAVGTLQRDLIEEMLIVSLVIIVFLWHFRSALIPIVALPIALLAAFVPMMWLHISSNLMSLGGLALAIGVMVDAAIVMVENGYRHLAEAQAGAGGAPLTARRRARVLLGAAQQVGPAIFFSLLIIVVSFLPVFLLQAQEGRMFRPLAWTKTLSVGWSSILAITLVPVLMVLLIRGRLKLEAENPLSRWTQRIYLPILKWALRWPKWTIALNVLFVAVTLPLAWGLGSQFMPSLYEGATLFMPTALPGISITTAGKLLQEQDRVLRSFPEVASVFGTVGRSDSATDNAPLSMYDTTITLKPRERWPAGMTYEKLIGGMDAKLQIPGLTNTWTMPIANRLDMELTGIKTPVGMKIQGPSLAGIQAEGERIQRVLGGMPQVRSIFAEKVADGYYVNIIPDRATAARYGLTVADVHRAVSAGIGGETVATNVEGRERFSISVRYGRDFRGDIGALRQVLIATPSGAQIPLGEVAQVTLSRGPEMIRDEEGQLTGYVYLDLNTRDYGGFVRQATALLRQKLAPAPGYSWFWSGEYEFELRAQRRLEIILPIVFVVIFVLLYMVFHSIGEAVMLIIPTIYALSGGLLLQWMLGYEFSVAVLVGYIALFGIAIETGVVMVVYLHEALDRHLARETVNGRAEVEAAAIEGAVQRLRPKLMTVIAVLASLGPILWESGIGSDVMKPIATPIVGGMLTSSINVLILVPVLFVLLKDRARRRGRLRSSCIQGDTSESES